MLTWQTATCTTTECRFVRAAVCVLATRPLPTRSDDESNANLFTVTARAGAARGPFDVAVSPDDDNDAEKLGILRTAARIGATLFAALFGDSSASCGALEADARAAVDVRSAVCATASSFCRCASAHCRHINFFFG